MKRIFALPGLLIFLFVGCDNDKDTTVGATLENTTGPDTALIRETGADEYGMKSYTLVFLKAGENRETDKVKLAELQKAHLNNLDRLVKEGKLLLAGPLLDDNAIRGICIFNCDTSEAKTLTASDPMVQSGHLIMEIHPWFGSAAVMKIPELHKRLESKSFTEIE